jgi:hypothetical protein
MRHAALAPDASRSFLRPIGSGFPAAWARPPCWCARVGELPSQAHRYGERDVRNLGRGATTTTWCWQGICGAILLQCSTCGMTARDSR